MSNLKPRKGRALNLLTNERAYRAKNRDKLGAYTFERGLRLRYGLTTEGYEAKLASQKGLCAICRRSQTIGSGRTRLYVDHNHVTNEVRGLLCNKCNLLLGRIEVPGILEAILRYLREWNMPKTDDVLPQQAEGDPKVTEEPNPFLTGDGVLKTIAQRFNLARVDGKVGAWRQFQRDLMDASPFIVPVIIPYKDLISIVSDIEKEIKGSNAIAGKSNEELLASFLKGENELGVDMTAPAPEGVDNSATIPSSGSSS